MIFCNSKFRKIDRKYEHPIDNIIIDTFEYINNNIIEIKTKPNYITIFRTVMFIFFWYKFIKDKSKKNTILLVLVYIFFYILDCLDGYTARKCDNVTVLGDYLDHISDIVGNLLMIFTLYPFKNSEVCIFLIFSFLLLSFFGCQQKQFNKKDYPYETLDYFKPLCVFNFNFIKYFSAPTYVSVITILFCRKYL